MDVGLVSRVVYPLHGFGGMEKHVYYLVTGLAERGVDVELFCMETDAEVPEELDHPNVTLTFLPYREWPIGGLTYLSFVRPLLSHFPRLDAKDVVHFQGIFGGIAYGFIGQNRPIYTTHGLEEFKHRHGDIVFLANPLEILVARKAHRIVSLGKGNTEEIMRFLRVGRDRVREIPNGVDVDLFRPMDPTPLRERHDLDGPTVVGISRLVDYKGFDLLIEAVDRLAKERPVELVIAGDGPDRDRLEALAEGTPARLAGRVPDEELPLYYSLADLFCLPTRGEGMPLSILEAFACSTPVLSTRTGSIPDLVDDEVGELVEAGSVDALVGGLDRMLDRDLEGMGEAARRRAVERFSWEAVVDRTLELYEEAAAG